MGYYAGRGFLICGVGGGLLAYGTIALLQSLLPPDSALNRNYPESIGWAPGLLLALGPLLGCAYYGVLLCFRRR